MGPKHGDSTGKRRPEIGAVAATLCALALLAAATRARAEGPTTFDGLAGAAAATDVVAALEDLTSNCDDVTDEVERRTCEAMRQELRERARARSHLVVLDPPRVTNGRDGARVITVSGCLLCQRPPVLAGAGRLITASEPPAPPPPPPARRGRHQRAPAPPPPPRADLGIRALGRVEIEDPGPAGRAAFHAALRRLRTQAVVRLDKPRVWRRGDQAGITVDVIGWRVIDPCSGKVYLSKPESGLLLPQTEDPVCQAAAAVRPTAPARAALPEQLSAEDLERTLEPVRQHAHRCFLRFRVRGRVDLTLDVRPDGTVKLVRSSGPLDDTPSSECVRSAAIRLRFPPFRSRTSMHITYPVLLR